MSLIKKITGSKYFHLLMGVIVAIILILLGTAALINGDLVYRNYWGGMVFAPFAIAIGIFFLIAVPFQWRKLMKRPKKLKGRDARRARRTAQYHSAIDDYDKPWRGGA